MYHATERGEILCLFSDPTESKSEQYLKTKDEGIWIGANVRMSFIYLHFRAPFFASSLLILSYPALEGRIYACF